ncbi:MAG: heavy metal-responsive transcriptional regulator [Candidatus Accumulibacter sp.]|jgi:MerR family copper efflux transcriptional regulator|nr:heavy metal-responsive transcriptional regulator [Accumulibacter sp.]
MNRYAQERRVRHLSIGMLAKETGVSTDTLRYYEHKGLLPPPQRSASMYREYDMDAAWRIRFILHAKELGFSLEEIGDLLRLSANAECARARASQRLKAVKAQIARLESVCARLSRLVTACPQGCDSPGCCPILSALRAEKDEI